MVVAALTPDEVIEPVKPVDDIMEPVDDDNIEPDDDTIVEPTHCVDTVPA